jgi:hypothetical protein
MNDPQMKDGQTQEMVRFLRFSVVKNLNNGWQGLFRGDPKFGGAKLVTAWQRLGRPGGALLF